MFRIAVSAPLGREVSVDSSGAASRSRTAGKTPVMTVIEVPWLVLTKTVDF